MQNTLRKQFLSPRVPNFHTLQFTINCFQDIAHFMIFAIDDHAKMSKCHTVLKIYLITKIINRLSLYSLMVSNALMKCLDEMGNKLQ